MKPFTFIGEWFKALSTACACPPIVLNCLLAPRLKYTRPEKQSTCQPADICQARPGNHQQAAQKAIVCYCCTFHPDTGQPLLPVSRPSSYLHSYSSRLGRSWKCQRTSRRQRRGRTRSSARWTRTWTANSHLRSLLRFGHLPFLCISFVRGCAREGNLAKVCLVGGLRLNATVGAFDQNLSLSISSWHFLSPGC